MIYHHVSFLPRSASRRVRWAHLGETTAPSHNLSIDLLSCLLLMIHDCLQETIEVLSNAVVVLDERVEALGQINAELRGVVPPHGLAAEMEVVFIVV